MLRYERRILKKGFKLIAGVDEAGRGPLAGPVVASAVILKSFHFEEKIDDSKRLSSPMRKRAFQEVMTKSVVGVGVVGQKIIDRINIVQATLLAMRRAIAKLPIQPDFLLIDGIISPLKVIPHKCIPGGDSKSLSVACASIIAKVTRDRIMQRYHRRFPKYSFDRHKGYGTERHLMTLKRWGPCPIHRMSFRPLKG